MLGKVFRSRTAVAITTAIVTASVVGGIAYAASSPIDSGGVIHGCYNPTTGAVKLLTKTACPTTGLNTPISWNTQGVQGIQGVPGLDGNDGAPGPKGDKGDQGPAAPLPGQRVIAVAQDVYLPVGQTQSFPIVDVSDCSRLSIIAATSVAVTLRFQLYSAPSTTSNVVGTLLLNSASSNGQGNFLDVGPNEVPAVHLGVTNQGGSTATVSKISLVCATFATARIRLITLPENNVSAGVGQTVTYSTVDVADCVKLAVMVTEDHPSGLDVSLGTALSVADPPTGSIASGVGSLGGSGRVNLVGAVSVPAVQLSVRNVGDFGAVTIPNAWLACTTGGN